MTRLTMFLAVIAATLACAFCVSAAVPERADAINLGPVCGIAGIFSGLAGKACGVVQNGGRLFGAGKKLLGVAAAHPGQTLGLVAIGLWVAGGARAAMEEAAKLIDHTTSPQLESSWFSSSYWRMAGLAFVLTLPFLFAAAVQAMLRSDLAMLARAAFGYLPLSVLAVCLAAPVTMLLLSASDEMSSIMSSAAGGDGVKALAATGAKIGLISTLQGSPFLAFLVGLFVAAGAFVLWLELLMRQAAVYVVVLMLPLAFAAMVWPARRIWAVRAVELLVALILSKFAIVAVLSLAAAALGHGVFSGNTAMLSGLVLVTLAAFAPWAMLRLLPLADIASAAAGSLKREAMPSQRFGEFVVGAADRAATPVQPSSNGSGTWGDAWSPDSSAEEGARSHTEGFAHLQPVPVMAGGGDEDDDEHGPESAGRTGGGGGPGAGPSGPGPRGGADARGAAGDPTDPREVRPHRLPDLDVPDVWQRENMTWPSHALANEKEWRLPSEDEPATEELLPEPAEDHDPLPPDQESEDGPL